MPTKNVLKVNLAAVYGYIIAFIQRDIFMECSTENAILTDRGIII